MGFITICGTGPLQGEVWVQRAKNSVLPILAAALLHRGVSCIEDCPRLQDVAAAADILRYIGCTVAWQGTHLLVDATTVHGCAIPPALMQRCRASILFLAPLLARCGEAELSFPGGCALGARPIDLHLAALTALGAEITCRDNTLHCRAAHLRGSVIDLPFPSVGATESAILCAAASEGVTILSGAAREPEIVDLQVFLQKMGVEMQGAGTSVITIRGGAALHPCSHRCIGDRIAAATYLCAAAASGGEVTVRGADYRHLSPVLTALRSAGCRLHCEEGAITLSSTAHLQAIAPIRTHPYPGFPTDAQPLLMAALLRAQGTSVVTETMFEHRFAHVPQLQQLGADITLAGREATIRGVRRLHGGRLRATDLRCGAALVIAALSAEGRSRLYGVEHILRGYDDLFGTLRTLGADIAETQS